MKLNFTYLFLLLAVLMSGCLGGSKNTPVPAPDGNFAGQFRLLHIHKNNTIDTVKANLQVNLTASSTYTVTGDTATVHAGSYGTFSADGNNNVIIFNDKTFNSSGANTKTHLSGVYQYLYKDNSTLQMVAYGPLDTLVLQYDLKKVN